MKKTTQQAEKQNGLLLSCQETARCLGLTKAEVRTMIDDGMLREVSSGGTSRVTARSISHMLGYDAFGQTALPAGGKYSPLSFEQYAVRALNRGVGKARSRTTENYRCALSFVVPEIGRIAIAELGTEDLRRAFRRMAGKYSKNSLGLAYTVTRMILREAYEAGDIPSDPTRRWERPKSTKPQRPADARVYTDAEIAELLRASREYDRELYTMFAVLECTGMRPGELLGLEWSSFDRAARTLHIYQAVTRQYAAIRALDKAPRSKSVLSVPKTEYSVRTLRLTETAAQALEEWHAALRACGDRARARSRFIFPGRHGRFRSLSGAEKKLQQFRAAYRLEGVTFYKFRHTMCTRLTLAREPISVIQRILGDNTPDVITQVYTHVGNEDALQALDRYFAERNGGTGSRSL